MRFVFLAALALAGCVHDKPIEAMGYEERKAFAGEILDRCLAQGVKINTPEMDACAEAEISAEAYTRSAAEARRQAYGAAMIQGNAARQQQMRCSQIGNTVNCYGS